MHLCAICQREQTENEPEFTRYVLGELDGHLCEECARPICSAVTAAVMRQRTAVIQRIRAATRELVRAVAGGTRRSA
jgi:hypothetical protein